MSRTVIAFLLLFCISQPAAGVILKGIFHNSNGYPVPDVMLFVDCRENYFFTDKDGVALTYVESDHIDCAISASREGFMVRYCLATIPESADTVSYNVTLVREGEPEPVVPCSDQSRFARIESCGSLIESDCSGDRGSTVILSFSNHNSDRISCIFTLSPDEEILLGKDGYDMENAEKITFLARSQASEIDVQFFSLIEDCDSPNGTFPAVDKTLSKEFTQIEIDLTRWNRAHVRSIWGCSIVETGKTEPQVIEIKDLKIIHSTPSPTSASAGTAH
ncbi:MAG: hypothetical protein KKG33_15085 [candidate division Zixibacteria bacterium]|nr:hypothetical protein [candidate division Zixibacteria bacterium]MBU1470488.1 hypothetical protein [candidate division Zixibacteria bacterium]MBU2626876.1 hypothetical protein [candidate division Zixibacteria bacterium]